MDAVRKGVWNAAGYALAVAAVDAWWQLGNALFARIGPPLLLTLGGLAIQSLLIVAAGAALAPLLKLRGGRTVHLLAVACVWLALQVALLVDSPLAQVPALSGPPAALVLVLAGRGLARWRPALPLALGAVLLAAGLATPRLYIVATMPEAPPQVALPPAAVDAPDVVLIVLDTVRASNMSAYGYARPTSPVFDALAKEGVLYLDATSPSTWSLASHASLFTGLFPSGHGAHFESKMLDNRAPTLAETLAAAGYDTRCFTANAFISPAIGLTRGFRATDEAWRSGGAARTFLFAFRLLDRLGFGAADKGGAAVVSSFERWSETTPADAPDARPAFVFINLLEAHFPYHQLPDAYLEEFSNRSRAELQPISMTLMGAQFGGREASRIEGAARAATDMYDGGILYTDHLLGRIVEALRRRGTLDDTVLVVMSDHGEMLGEHGFYGHGEALYEPSIRVPLMLRYPARVPSGVRVSTPVSTVGVYATIADLLDLDPPERVHVGSLVPAMHGGAPGGPVMSERYGGRPGGDGPTDPVGDPSVRVRTYRAGSLKLIQTSGGKRLLFDLAADPGETTDVAAARPGDVDRLLDEVDTWRAALAIPALDAAVEPGAEPDLDPEARERLRALGYVD
ncbi:MAG: sulfatase [Deltaproteobacteria bacterium]|nr:sulfatase [Deltaproteobacteria bacterium]